MRILFLGTSEFAVPSLKALLSDPDATVVCVVTQEDRPSGRGQRIRPTPVKMVAAERALPVFQPLKVRSDESRQFLEPMSPDLVVVVAYGQILPRWLLDLPGYGAINVHGSLLPRYRGAAPIQWAILRGETCTGVTTMLMDEGLDTGPTLLQHQVEILPEETAGELHDRLAILGSELLLNTIHRLRQGTLVARPQDDSLASLAPKITKEQAAIHWGLGAQEISCLVRAFNPWPVAEARLRGQELKIFRSRAATASDPPSPDLRPGEISVGPRSRLRVGCGARSALELLEVSLPGRKRISGAELVHGLQLKSGDWFETDLAR